MSAQPTEIRARLRAIITDEFEDEIAQGWVLLDDRLHASVGDDGTAYWGLSPISDYPWQRDAQVEASEVFIQFYGAYDKQVDPHQTVDPAAVEAYADRLKRAIQAEGRGVHGDERAWFFNVTRTDYPNDATGNKTRFEMYVTGYGTNPALVETTG